MNRMEAIAWVLSVFLPALEPGQNAERTGSGLAFRGLGQPVDHWSVLERRRSTLLQNLSLP